MRATFIASPRFNLWVTPQELETLVFCSTSHYDGVCKDASKVGGFLYGWTNMAPEDKTADIWVSCTGHELQTCMKILESPPNGYTLLAHRMSKTFRACIDTSLRELSQLSWEVPS